MSHTHGLLDDLVARRQGGCSADGVPSRISCLRCCWALMILLFVLGVMNLFWVALLAIFVLAEKASRRGETISLIGGLVMIVWGIGAILRG